MNCAQRTGVYALLVSLCVLPKGITSLAKDNKDRATVDNVNTSGNTTAEEFPWNEHGKLSWSDFRGPVEAISDESAAATHCGIGFKTCTVQGKPKVIVYNTFYTNRSWVKNDAKIQSVLDHEQGHFDLCEIYTRKLRERMNNFNFEITDVKSALMSIYNEVKNEYESRQMAYESETVHGTNIPEQQRWIQIIAHELLVSDN